MFNWKKKNKRKEHPLNGGYKTPLLKVAGLLEGNSDRRLLIGHLSLSASIFVSYQLFQQNCPFLLSVCVYPCNQLLFCCECYLWNIFAGKKYYVKETMLYYVEFCVWIDWCYFIRMGARNLQFIIIANGHIFYLEQEDLNEKTTFSLKSMRMNASSYQFTWL